MPLPVAEALIAPPKKKKRTLPDGSRPELRPRRAPDATTTEKSRGRLEIRELWVVDAGDLGPYLADEWGWADVAQIGWVRRWRRRRPRELWTVEEVIVITSCGREHLAPAQLLGCIRMHWSIENRVHWPRDVTFQEDRLHGRLIGPLLAWLRNMAINLMRRVYPGRFLPDIQAHISAALQHPLRWMLFPLRN